MHPQTFRHSQITLPLSPPAFRRFPNQISLISYQEPVVFLALVCPANLCSGQIPEYIRPGRFLTTLHAMEAQVRCCVQKSVMVCHQTCVRHGHSGVLLRANVCDKVPPNMRAPWAFRCAAA